MRKLLLIPLLLLAFAPAAQADRISTDRAESIWYNNFNWHCGNGDTWICGTRLGSLQCWPTYGAPHRNSCDYWFAEHRIGGYNRWCHIWGDLLHTTVYYWREEC